jgi:Fur family ferric uptake transcriptional regulator
VRSDLNMQACDMLKAVKLYRTENRVAVLKILLKANGPLKQDEIAHRLGRRFNKVSIYRALETLLGVGLVHKAYMGKRAWHFELAHNCTKRQCHPHFICTNCGSTHCLTEMRPPMIKSPYKGYVIKRQQVRLEGLCPACA